MTTTTMPGVPIGTPGYYCMATYGPNLYYHVWFMVVPPPIVVDGRVEAEHCRILAQTFIPIIET